MAHITPAAAQEQHLIDFLLLVVLPAIPLHLHYPGRSNIMSSFPAQRAIANRERLNNRAKESGFCLYSVRRPSFQSAIHTPTHSLPGSSLSLEARRRKSRPFLMILSRARVGGGVSAVALILTACRRRVSLPLNFCSQPKRERTSHRFTLCRKLTIPSSFSYSMSLCR